MSRSTVNDLDLVFKPISAPDVQDAYRIEVECENKFYHPHSLVLLSELRLSPRGGSYIREV